MSDNTDKLIVTRPEMGSGSWICPKGQAIRIGSDNLHGIGAWEPLMLHGNANRSLEAIWESLRRIEDFFGNSTRLEGCAWNEAAQAMARELMKIRVRLHGATGGQPSDGLHGRKPQPG